MKERAERPASRLFTTRARPEFARIQTQHNVGYKQKIFTTRRVRLNNWILIP